ncbi:MAG: tetratricopeptide repeat protein [Acidobacteriia bacterium]|nr:tetratricopeptide repeat protein [Terriglobia bacterium]
MLELAAAGYNELGNRLGQANCIQSLGDIHLRRSDHDFAHAAYQKALAMYRSISDPYSSGRALYSLARLETTPKTQRQLVAEAVAALTSINRPDLIATLQTEFPNNP